MKAAEDISNLRKQISELQTKAQKAATELSNMIKAQGNLYRFQEKVERQRTIYAQVAEVGHQFNQSLDFARILEAVQRFLVDHLNYERCFLILPDANSTLRFCTQAGYHSPEEKKLVQEFSLGADSALVRFFSSGKNKAIFSDKKCSSGISKEDFAQLCELSGMDEWIAYSLGQDGQNQNLGVLFMGNQKKHFVHHLRVVDEPEDDALFANIASQIVAAQNTTKFLQKIQIESAQVKRLLNNMSQAVFSMDAHCRVTEPVSLFAKTIFEQDLVGQNVFETIFKDVPPGSEELASLRTIFATVFGEGQLQWQLMEDQFLRRVRYQISASAEKILKVNYAPIWTDQETLEKIMFVVEDITELEKLEKQVSEDRLRIQLIQEIAGNDILNLNRNFFDRALTLYNRCKELIPQFSKNGEVVGELMRSLHTLKGNARMHGFSLISRQVHHCESEILECKNRIGKEDPASISIKIEESTNQVLESVQKYGTVAQKVFGVRNKFAPAQDSDTEHIGFRMVEIHEENLRHLENAIQKASHGQPGMQEVRKALSRLRDMPLKPSLAKFEPMVREVSNSLGKKIKLEVTGNDSKLNRQSLEDIRDSLVHVVRNALDHGIEPPEERLANGKSEFGRLTMNCQEDDRKVTLTIEDDGRGIDPDLISKLAIEKGVLRRDQVLQMNPEEKMSIIFISGFSSKNYATEISGRGVGLDMVKQTLLKLGAQIRVESRVGQGSKFIMEFPVKE